MSEKIVYGTALANSMIAEAHSQFDYYRDLGNAVHFTTVLVGGDAGSKKYIDMKQAEGTRLGVSMSRIDLDKDITQIELEEAVEKINVDNNTHAILVQYPLPASLDYLRTIQKIDPHKDADGLHPYNLGLLMHDPVGDYPGIIACTPNGIIQLLELSGVSLDGAYVVVVGRGMTVGAPLTMLLSAKNNGPSATVTTLHRRSVDISRYTRNADIVIGATGIPGLIDGSMIKKGTVLVSVGVAYDDHGKAKGDFSVDARDNASVYVPVTKGIGPMTRANLWKNVIRCYELQQEASERVTPS